MPWSASAAARSSPRPRSTCSSRSRSSPPAARLAAIACATERRLCEAIAGRTCGQPSSRRRVSCLEVAVGLGLLLEHRRRPAVLARLHHLVVPVGALHEPHDQRRLRGRVDRGPLEHLLELLRRLAQVGLQHDARGRARRAARARRAGRRPARMVASSVSTDSMSMCRWAPSSFARSSSGRIRRAASSRPTSGASGRSSGLSADTFTDTFTRGTGPSESLLQHRPLRPARGRRRPASPARRGSAPRSGRPRAAVTVASPSRSSETAAPCSHRWRIGRSAARGVSPTMKRCAMWRTPAAAAAPSAARPGLRAATCASPPRSAAGARPTSSR